MRGLLALLALVLALPAHAQTVIQPPVSVGAATSPSPAYVVGNYFPGLSGYTVAGSAIATGAMRLQPTPIMRPITIDGLAVMVSTLASGGNATLHLYSSLSGNRPTGTSTSCTVSTTTTGVKTCTFGSPVTISTPGVYWLAIEVDATASSTAIFQAITGQSNASLYQFGSATLSVLSGPTQGRIQLSWSHTYGASSDITSATLTEYATAADALIYYHVSSIP
jgi:hypothetical protein